nr:nesprin 1 [Hymenolepis microstoma]
MGDLVIELTDEQERIQKKTFTNWVNTYLAKAIPPDYVRDLFVDIRDGVKLVRLLEVLADVRLIKLVNINPADIVDGRPAIVLGLIWSIILSFHIDAHGDVLRAATAAAKVMKEDTSTPSGSVANATPQQAIPPVTPVAHKKALLAWVHKCISSATKLLNIQVRDFGVSWRDGRAFCALVHSIEAECMDLNKIKPNDNKANLEIAFRTADRNLGIPYILDVEDVDVDKPDERSIMTYIAQFLKQYPTGKKQIKPHNQNSGNIAPARSLETSLDAVDSAIDPSLVLSASTVSLHNAKTSNQKEAFTTPTSLLDDEGIRSLLAATSSSLSGSEEEMKTNPEVAQSMPNIVRSTMHMGSPRRQGRARTYADLRLARVAKTYSRCRAIANIRVTGDRTEETKNTIKDSNAQAEEERQFVIHIKELISRIRYDPLEAQDLLQELQELYEAEKEHQTLTTCLVELGNRKRQGILLGILPSELAEIEAKWTKVKPALDEWRWRLDDSLPGDWATVGRWLGQLERCLSASARLAIEMDVGSISDADAATRRAKFDVQLENLKERLFEKDRMTELLDLLFKTNTPDEPSALPETVVNAIKKRFQDVCYEAENSLRRISRLHLRWKLTDEIAIINEFINMWKNTRFQRLEDALDSVEKIRAWKKEKDLPNAMDTDIAELDDLCKDSEDKAISDASTTMGEQPVAGLLTIQIKAGGGTLIMRDIAETERAEISMFLSSLRVRWADAQRDLDDLEKSSLTLFETWKTYETETQNIYAWMQDAENKLRRDSTGTSEKRLILSQLKSWRDRLSALQDLGAALIGQSTISTGQAINKEMADMFRQLENITNEVERSTQAETIENLKRDFEFVLNHMNDLLQNANNLINKEVLLPQTTSMQKAEEATSEYSHQLKDSKEKILKSLEYEYKLAEEILQKLMAASKDGDIDFSEVEHWMQETERLRNLLQQMANEKINNRLSELALAMREAVSVAIKLAQMSEWIEEAESATNADIPRTMDEISMNSLGSISPDEAIRRLEKHCKSINDQTKALEEAESRLEELKAKGLKSVNISELETSIAETRERINIILEQTRKREQLLLKQSQTREGVLKAAESLEQWLSEAELVVTTSLNTMLLMNNKTLAESACITQWSLDRLEQQRNAHEIFCDEHLLQGTEFFDTMNQSFESFVEVWPVITASESAETEIVVCAKEVVSRVECLRQRYNDVVGLSPRALLTVRFLINDVKIGEKLMEASEKLRQEESRIEAGEEVNSVLSEHEAYFFSPDFLEELPALVIEMENILSELVEIEPDLAEQYAQRTEVRSKILYQLKGRAEQFAINMRELPEKWLDFDAKLGGLEHWTSEFEELANQLCSDGLLGGEDLMDPEVAAEVARRYRAMLEKFEEMIDSTNSNVSLAERLNNILQELIGEGGLSPSEIANRRTNLARVLNSLHDVESMTSDVRQTASKRVESLDQQYAAALAEHERANRLRTNIEEIASEPDIQFVESDEMKRLLAERDALIARVNEEKKTSLAYLMQMSTLDQAKIPQMRPKENRFLRVWEDADRVMEEKAANLRTATEASEQFEEVRNRLSNLLGSAVFLLKGNTSPGISSSITNEQVSNSSYEAFAQFATGDDLTENKVFTNEDISAYGPTKIQEQSSAIETHLKSLDKASADIEKLRAGADLIAEQLGPENSAELTAIIDKLERDIVLAKSALVDRLAALELASSKWVEIQQYTKKLEAFAEAQEDTLQDLKTRIVSFNLKDCTDIASARAAYRQLLDEYAMSLNKLKSDSSALSAEINDLGGRLVAMMTVERVDENGNVIQEILDDADPEVVSLKKTLDVLRLRQKGIDKGCSSAEVMITAAIAALEEFGQVSSTIETYLDQVNGIKAAEFSFDGLDDVRKAKEQLQLLRKQIETDLGSVSSKMRDLSPFLKNAPQLADQSVQLLRRWESADGWLISRASIIDTLVADWSMWTNEMDKITQELQQLAESMESTRADTTDVTLQRANQVAQQLEAVRLLKARWKALRPQTETVLSLLSNSGPKGALRITMESTHHTVPRRYTLVGLNTKLEGELDEQDKFTNDVEKLIHMISVAEKRLSRVTGIWIPSAPILLSTHPHISLNRSQSQADDAKQTKETDSTSERIMDGYINLQEAIEELKSLFSEISGHIHTTIESLMSQVKQLDTEEATAQERLQFLSREISLLALRALKRQYICEVSHAYEQHRSAWFGKLRGLRSIQEQLIQAGATVEILSDLPDSEETSKLLKTIPVDRSYEEDCIEWLKALNGTKVEILGYKFTSERPKIPDYLQGVEEEAKFENDFTPQELDTASIATGIFFVTGRRDEVLVSASSLEPFSFYVDVGRIISDSDKLKTGMINHWNSLNVYCTNWLQFTKGSDEFADYTKEFLENTLSLVKSAVELTNTRLDRPGNHNRLSEISTQLREWQEVFESPTEADESTAIPLVSRLLELQKEAEKLIELAPSRTLAVRSMLDRNRTVLLNGSIRLCETAYQLERLIKAYDSRDIAIRSVNEIVKEAEQQAGFRSVSKLATNLLGIEISPDLIAADELIGVSSLKMEMSYKSDLEGILQAVRSSRDLAKLVGKLSKARTYLRAHLPPKLMHLQQSSSAAICAFEVIMNEKNSKPSIERLEDDTLRNRIVSRSQRLSDILDESVKMLEEKHQTMTLIEANIDNINSWVNELLPRVQSAIHLLSVSTNESVIPEAIQFTEGVEDPGDLLEVFNAEQEHYSKLSELTKLEIDSDSEILHNVFDSQTKTIADRFGGLISAVSGMEDLWKSYLAQDDAVNNELNRESDQLKVLIDRLDKISLQSGPSLVLSLNSKERIEVIGVLADLFEETQQIRSEYMDMISRVEVLSNRCFNRDSFRMHLKRRKLLRYHLGEEKENKEEPEIKPKDQLDSLSKHCANLSFRLASVDTQVKRCMGGICKRISRVQNDATTSWSMEVNALSERLEKLGSFAELPLLLKVDRRDSVSSYFCERKREIQDSKKRIDNLESELSCIVELYKMVQRFQHCENGPANFALGDDLFNTKNRTMIAALRQNLIEYAIHVGELHSTLNEMFTTISKITLALEDLHKRLEIALNNIEAVLDLSSCEIALAQFSSIKNDLEPLRSELRTLQTLGNQSNSAMHACISKGASLIASLGTSNTSEQTTCSPQDTISHFTVDFAALDKKFHWMACIVDEADDRLSALTNSFNQYDHRVKEAKAWLHQSQTSLKLKSERNNATHSLGTEEAEMYLAMVQSLVSSFNDGKRLVNVMEGAALELQSEAVEMNRWMGNIRQAPYFHASSNSLSSPLPSFREGLMRTNDTLKDDLANYLTQLNSEKKRAEIQLTTCSTFCSNCSRFIDWLCECESKWAIPSVGEKDPEVAANEEFFFWEKQALVSTYKQRTTDIQVHEVLLRDLFQSAELDYESDANGSPSGVHSRLIDARKRFNWLQQCVATRLTTTEDQVKRAEEKEALQRAFFRSVESVQRRFTTLEWEIVEISTWEKLNPITSEPIIEMLEEVVVQLSNSLQLITEFSRELDTALETVGDAPSSPRIADETRKMLLKLRNLRLNTEKYIKACLVLSNSYRILNSDINKFKARIVEKAYISELTSPDVCRLTNEEWSSLRNDILVEQSVLWQIEEELNNENFDEKFNNIESAFEEFLNAIGEVAQTSASQCSAAHKFKSRLMQLRELYANCKKNLFEYQTGLDTQLSKGDLYHDELNMCQDRLNNIEADLGDILNSAVLRGAINTWTQDTKDLVVKVTAIERRLCDFQTKELESLMVIAQSGEEFLPLAAQAVQDRWSDLVNRAMNARSVAELALTSIQDSTDAFINMKTWIQEAEERLNAIINKPIDEPSKPLIDSDEPRFILDEWSGLAEAQSLRFSKLTKLHAESVARRKVILSTTEELGKLKGSPPSKADSSVIRALEQELADSYADLIEHSQTAVNSEQDAVKNTQAAIEDANAAVNATEKLSDRANTLLFREELGVSLEWQQTCFSDFLSIELATVRELIERSRKWTAVLPYPDAQFAETISSKLMDEVTKIEARINERVELMGKFQSGLNEILQRIGVEEAWQTALSSELNPAFRDAPSDLMKKREMIDYFESKLTGIDKHVELVKRISIDFEKLTSGEGKMFAIPHDTISQIQALQQNLILQQQTAENQRLRWIQISDQHICFVRDLCETYYLTSCIAAKSTQCFNVFQDVCKTGIPSAEMIAWGRETCLPSGEYRHCIETLKCLNDKFNLICSSEGSEGESRISYCLKNLNHFTRSLEQVIEGRQTLLDLVGVRVNEFGRCAKRFAQTLDAFNASFQQILTVSTIPTNTVLLTLLDDAKNDLSQDSNNLEKEMTSIQTLVRDIRSSGLQSPVLQDLDEGVSEGVKWERKDIKNTPDPPETCSLDASGILNEQTERKSALITTLTNLYEMADKFSDIAKRQRQARKASQDWLSETSRQLEVCRSLAIEHASSSQAISLHQKANNLRMRQRNVDVLMEAHKSNEHRFITNLEAEKEITSCRTEYLKALSQECHRCEITPNFALQDEGFDAAALHSDWKKLLVEMGDIQNAIQEQLLRCEEASSATIWMVNWLREVEKRALGEDASFIENFRPTLSRRGHNLRAYSEETETLDKISEKQQEVVKFWQNLDEEITNKKAEFDEYEFRISKIQSDSSTNAQAFRDRFDNAAETARSHLQQNIEGTDILNRVCQQLRNFNAWVLAIQERASNADLSIQNFLGQESETATIEQGEECVSSLSGVINQLLTECAEVREQICPLSAACLLSADLLSHLNVVWRSIKAEVQNVRQKYQSDSEAIDEFSSRLNALAIWMKEKEGTFCTISSEFNSFSNRSVVSFAEELKKCESFPSPSESVLEDMAICLKRKEKLVSDTCNLINQLNTKSRDFEVLQERLQELDVLKVDKISQIATETNVLMEKYSGMRSDGKKLLEQSEEMLSSQQNLHSMFNAFQTWRDELSRSLQNASDFSGDRYALMVRLDWLNDTEAIRQKGEKQIADLKKTCVKCMATSPPDLLPALLSATNEHAIDFNKLLSKITDSHSQYLNINEMWEKFDAKTTEFDSCHRRVLESITKFEVPYSEDLPGFLSKANLLSLALDALDSPEEVESATPGLCEEIQALRTKFSQVSEYHVKLKSLLDEVYTKEDSSVTSTILIRSNRMKSLRKTLQNLINTWRKLTNEFEQLFKGCEVLENEVSDFGKQIESLSKESVSCNSLIIVNDLITRCEMNIDKHRKLGDTLKLLKERSTTLTPHTSNATILELQGSLATCQNKFISIQNTGRSLVKQLRERLEINAKLITELSNYFSTLSDAEETLLRLTTSGRLVFNISFPKSMSLASRPCSELTFAFVKLSKFLQEYMNEQKQSLMTHSEKLSKFQQELTEKQGDIQDVLNLNLLEDETSFQDRSALKRRLSNLLEQTKEVKKTNESCEVFMTELNSHMTKAIEELGLCVDSFVQLESESRRVSDDFLANSEPLFGKLTSLLGRINDANSILASVRKLDRKLPTKDSEWKDYVGMCDILLNEFKVLKQKVEQLKATIGSEVQNLKEIEKLQKELSDLHLNYKTKCSLVPTYVNRAPNFLDTSSSENVVSQFSSYVVLIRTAKDGLQSASAEYARNATSILSSLSDSIKTYSSHRKQPVGMLITRMESQKVIFEDTARQYARLDKEITEEISKWDEFITLFRGLLQWFNARENDFQALSAVETVTERTNFLRDLEETLRKTGAPMFDRALSSSCSLRSLRSNLNAVNMAMSWITDRYNALLKSVSDGRSELKSTILAKEELRKSADYCLEILERQEAKLTDLGSQSFSVPSPALSIEGIDERLRRLEEFQHNLDESKTAHLNPLNERIQTVKNQLKTCGFDQAEVNDAVNRIAELWKFFNLLKERYTKISSGYEKLAKGGKEFMKQTREMSSWLKEQRETFFNLHSDTSVAECASIQDLVGCISKRSNAMHQFCMELNTNGGRYLSECLSSADHIINIAKSLNISLLQDRSPSKIHTRESLIASLDKDFQDLSMQATKQKDELLSLLLFLTAYAELFTNLQNWVTFVEDEVSKDTDEERDIQLYSTPSSYITIRSAHVLSLLAQGHERAGQIGEKQAHLDVLLSRSNRLLEEWGSSEMTRFAAQKVSSLSRRFVGLTMQVKRQIEINTIKVKNIEVLQESRNAYTNWEKEIRSKFGYACQEEKLTDVLAHVKRIFKSLEMGNVLLESCQQLALTVQSDALGSNSTDPALAQDLMASYESLKSAIAQKLETVEKQVSTKRAKQLSIDSLSSWLEGAEQKLQGVISSIYSPAHTNLKNASFNSVIAFFELSIGNGISELSALQSECINRETFEDDPQIASRLYPFKTRLSNYLSELEERAKNLNAYREASELVSIRQRMTLERYVQVISRSMTIPESASEIVDPSSIILEALLSAYDAERRLAILRGINDELLIEGRQLLDTMIGSADRLISNSIEQSNSCLSDVISVRNEELRDEQINLERVSKQSIELLESVNDAWEIFSRTEEDLSDWLMEMEQTSVRPTFNADMPIDERKRILSEMQSYLAQINKKYPLFERHLTNADQLNRRIPQFQAAEKAKQLHTRYTTFLNSVQAQFELHSTEEMELSSLESTMTKVLAKIDNFKSLLEECWVENRLLGHTDLVSKQISIKKVTKELDSFKNSEEMETLQNHFERVKAFVSSSVRDAFSRRIGDIFAFLEVTINKLQAASVFVSSRLETWEAWSSLTRKLEEELNSKNEAYKRILLDVKGVASSNPADVLAKRREAIDKLQEMHSSLVRMKPDFTELRSLMNGPESEMLDQILYQKSSEIAHRKKTLSEDVQTQRDRLKHSWEALFTYSNKVNAADQWLLAASVKLTALNNANPDGPKATEFLIKNCKSFSAEVSMFMENKLQSLISEGQHLESAREMKRRKRKDKAGESCVRTDAFKQLLEQLNSMRSEADGLIKVTQDIERSLNSKAEDWLELLAKLQSGESYMEINMPRWWEDYVDHSQSETTVENPQPLSASLRRKVAQQPEAVLEEIFSRIKEVEKRRFELESASNKVTSPWTPVQTPSTVQQRLQKAGADDSDIISASVSADEPRTSGSKVRNRAENLKRNYAKQVKKMKALCEQLNNWKSLWYQQLLCEAEVADWLQTKESTVSGLFAGKGLEALDLSTSSLNQLRAELLAKRDVIDELANWRRNLLGLPSLTDGDDGSDPIGELSHRLDTLVRRIGKRVELHRHFVRQAKDATKVKTEVQENLEKMVQSMSRGHSTLHLRTSPHTQNPLRNAQSTSVIYQRRGPSPLSIQLPNDPSPVVGSLEWLWYSPTSVLEQQSPLASSPSPPRLSFRPIQQRIGRINRRLGRSTPLINIREKEFPQFPSSALRNFVMAPFTDIRLGEEGELENLDDEESLSPNTIVSTPPILPLLLCRSISPRRGRSNRGWRRGWSMHTRNSPSESPGSKGGLKKPAYYASCADLLSTFPALPPRSGYRQYPTASDIARRRYRRRLEQTEQRQNEDTGN